MAEELIGKYRVLRSIGAGGMATVFLACHKDIPSLKIVLKKLSDPHLAERFMREADKLAQMDGHVGICQIKHFFEHDGDCYIVMEHIDGPDLDQLIKSDNPPDIPTSIDIICSTLATLDYAHRKGIVHRDIKPTNIMVDSEGQVKVIDFGVAKGLADPDLTQVGTSLGSPRYMAPEQFNAQSDVDWVRCDLYAVGMTLYYLLARTLPFMGASLYEMCAAKQKDDVPPPSAANPQIPPELDAVVMRAMAADPYTRFATAAEMRTVLLGVNVPATPQEPVGRDRTMVLGGDGAVAESMTMSIKPTPIATPTPGRTPTPTPAAAPSPRPAMAAPQEQKPAKSRRGLIAAIGLVVVVGAIGTVAVMKFGAEDRTEPPPAEVVVQDPPRLIAPGADAVLNNFRPEFRWDTSGDSLGTFTLQFAGNETFTKSPRSGEYQGGQHRPASSLAAGVYFWRVRQGGREAPDSDWSAVRSFTIEAQHAAKPRTNTGATDTKKPAVRTEPVVKKSVGKARLVAKRDNVPFMAPACKLLIDGKEQSSSLPTTLELSAGDHLIVAVYMYEGVEIRASRTITVTADVEEKFYLEFE